ncbi:MAG: septum formation family protein [Microcella sp.]|uniref:septum formation family protein n=1 Tax=Microcella sp. TaxID=1913979 RepID=UPI0033152C2E
MSSPAGLGRVPCILLWVAGALVAVLALVGLFLLGTRLPDLLEPAPVVTPTPTPTPTETVEPVGPVEPGEYRWDDLLGGECLDPFVDAWQDEYTVVDCALPHGGQLLARVAYDSAAEEDAPYPGEEALSAPLYLACTDPAVLVPEAAGAYDDLAVQGSYPVTEEQWDDGYREYSCFVSRSSGEPITGSLSAPEQ